MEKGDEDAAFAFERYKKDVAWLRETFCIGGRFEYLNAVFAVTHIPNDEDMPFDFFKVLWNNGSGYATLSTEYKDSHGMFHDKTFFPGWLRNAVELQTVVPFP